MTLSSLVGGAYSVTATVDPDPDGGEYHLQPFGTVQVVVVGSIPNNPPNLSPDPIPDQQASEGNLFALTVNASDPDSGQTLTFTVLEMPAWLNMDTSIPAQVTLSGTPGESDGGTTSVVMVEVSDGQGGTDSDTFELIVIEANQQPVLDPIPTQIIINEGQIATFDANATDPDIPAQTLTYSLVGAPVDATIDSSTGFFEWNTTSTDSTDYGPGNYTLSVRASDGISFADASVTITVKGKTTIVIDDDIYSEYVNNLINLRTRLVDSDTGEGISGEILTFSTSPSQSIPDLVTGGIEIVAPAGSTEIPITHCTTCPKDDNQAADDNENEVLHAEPGTIFNFGPDNKQVNFYLMDVGNALVTLKFVDAANPDNTIIESFEVQEGGFTIAGFQFPTGVGQVEVVDISQLGGTNPEPGTIGISRIVTFNAQAGPPIRFDEDFERYGSIDALSSTDSVSDGLAFPLILMPNENIVVMASFAGNSIFAPSSETHEIAVRDTDQNANSGIFNPTSDSGLVTTFSYISCVTDSDKDGLCDADEDNGYLSTAAGNLYICPGGGPGNVNPCGLNKYHKNLLIEIDYYKDRKPSAASIGRIIAAFADLNVENPDKTKGITLTILLDDELTPAQGFPAVLHVWTDADATCFNDFDCIKQQRFGTATERGALTLDNNVLLQRKAMIYHYGIIAASIGTGNVVNCNSAAFGVSEEPLPANDFVVAMGCSKYGANDPNYAGLKLGTTWELEGILMHEVGHQIGYHHNGPVSTQNLKAVNLNSALTQITASKAGVTSVTKPTTTTVKVIGTTISTTGAYDGFLRIDTTVTLSAASTITIGTITKNTSPGGALNMETPLVLVTSGAGTSTQTLSWYFPIRTTGPVSNIGMGAWTASLSLGGKTISSVSLKAGSPVMTNVVPSEIYTQNCNPNHPSVMAYSWQTPEFVDKATYFSSPGVFNVAYTPTNWRLDYTRAQYPQISESGLLENQGLKESFYASSKKIVFAYGAATRYSAVGSTWTAAPIWINWDGDGAADSSALASDVNNFGIPGCGSSPGQQLRSNFAETTNVNLIFGPANGGLVESRAGHGDVSTDTQDAVEVTTTGFIQPINPGGPSEFNIGDTIPAKLKYFENGVIVPNLTDIKFAAVKLNPDPDCTDNCAINISISNRKGADSFKWDSVGQLYTYGWPTKGQQPGNYIIFAVKDGIAITYAEIVLR
jgi:hypothetical protein